jgi:anti-sigma B factor antagonist
MYLLKKTIQGQILKITLGENLLNDEVHGEVELDIESQATFIDFMQNVFDEEDVHVVLDMSNIVYMDSSGLWALFEGHKRAELNKGKLVVFNPTKDVKRVLDITKMSSKIKIFNSEQEAVEWLSQSN